MAESSRIPLGTPERPAGLAVLASGAGSNLRALGSRIENGDLPEARIAIVVSNRSTSGALDYARTHGIPAYHISERTDPGNIAGRLTALFTDHGVDLIVLAGYLRKLPATVLERYRDRALNIHPALLPAYGGDGMYGAAVHRAVLDAREPISGASVHLVSEEYDEGPVLSRRTVPVLPDDDAASLATRVLAAKHDLYWRVVRAVVTGRPPP